MNSSFCNFTNSSWSEKAQSSGPLPRLLARAWWLCFSSLRSLRMLERPLLVSFFLLDVSIAGFLVAGYHPGAEDDGVYLAAIKSDLDPSLYPHDSAFFKLQMEDTVFDTMVAGSVRLTRMPLTWAALSWQFLSIVLFLSACWTIVCQLFAEWSARCAAIAMCSAMFTLPVAGTALYIVDQYLHPRALATALILFGVSRIVAGRGWQSIFLLAFACMLHPIMGVFGIMFCVVAGICFRESSTQRAESTCPAALNERTVAGAALIPMSWLFHPQSQTWLQLLRSRHWSRIDQWTWYEDLGIVGPLVLFGMLMLVSRKSGERTIERFAKAVLLYAILCQTAATIILRAGRLIALSAVEPMRYLHLVYVFLTLFAGAYMGKHILKTHLWRWAVWLIAANCGMYLVQRQVFSGTEHIEWPGQFSANPWIQTFDWIKRYSPRDSYFALDPNYLEASGEDFHSFRALAERSTLADAVKDASVVTKVPDLGPQWSRQVTARDRWSSFRKQDFERLKAEFGVDWVILPLPRSFELRCPWHNDALAVCNIP